MKILIAYASFNGHTQVIAEWVARWFQEHGVTTELVNVVRQTPNNSLKAYTLVLLAAPIHMAKHHPAMIRFLREHVTELKLCQTAFVSVSGSAGLNTPSGKALAQGYSDTLVTQTGFSPNATLLLGGAYQFTKYNPLLRWIMTLITRKEGLKVEPKHDMVLTDYGDLGSFLERIVPDADKTPKDTLLTKAS